MSADNPIEIIDLDDELTKESNDIGIANLFKQNLSGNNDDDIVCLDTVFKAAGLSNNHKTTGGNIAFPVNSKKEGNETAEDQRLVVDENALPPQNEVLASMEEAGPSKTDYLSSDEESIDFNLAQVGDKDNIPSTAKSVYNASSTEIKEPASKKPKISETEGSSSTSFSAEVHLQLSQYRKPPGSFHELIVLVLKNAKCLVGDDIWDYVSGLFPFYEFNFDVQQGREKVRKVVSKGNSFFLRISDSFNSKNKKLIMLSPVKKYEQDLIVSKLESKKFTFMRNCMHTPQLFDSFITGNLVLSSAKLLHFRPRPPGLSSDSSGVSREVTWPNYSPITIAADREPDDPAVSCGGKDATEDLSPNSNSSSDTIVFEPQIVNCRTLEGCDLDIEFNTPEEEDTSSSGNKDSELNMPLRNLSQIVNQFDTPFLPESSSGSFVNTVWTRDDEPVNNSESEVGAAEPPSSSPCVFPEVEKCIPRWKEIFPWVCWKPWLKKIFCSTCQAIQNKIEPVKRTVVIEISHPDDVFKVSKELRLHSEKSSHKTATILGNKNIISTLYFLLDSHFNEFQSTEEILKVFEDVLSKDVHMSLEMLKSTISMLGQFLEDRIIQNLKCLKRFAVITDPCAGLLIVRWLNGKNEPEEHIISSYSGVYDKTPTEYLTLLGVQIRRILVYVSNSRCNDCNRCKVTKKVAYKTRSPLRMPQLDRFLVFLWRTKLLKPFYSMGSTLCKLWISFPYKFSHVAKIVCWEKLTKFPSDPTVFIEVFEHFSKLKEVAANIYTLTGGLEALGFQTIDPSKFAWMVDIFPILASINIQLMGIKFIHPFEKGFNDLFQGLEKLKMFCEECKKKLKNEEIQTWGIKTSDIDDLYHLVQLTIKEFQEPIYHKGKSVSLAYSRLTSLRNLKEYKSNGSMKSSFLILYGVLRNEIIYEENTFIKCLTTFLTDHQSCDRKNAMFVLEYFQNNKDLSREHTAVYRFYRSVALFAFQPSKVERCAYESKVYDHLFYQSAWTAIGPNTKNYLLTIISELSGKNQLSEKEMQGWWVEKYQS